MDRDHSRVRIVSFAAAGAVMAAALLACAFYRIDADIAEGAPAVAIPAFVENPHPIETVDTPPPRAQRGAPNLAAAQGDDDDSLRLWRYGQHNEIVFSYAEQFDRCTEARRKHIDAADCPSSRETRAYVLDPSDNAPLVLAYRRH